MVFHHDMPPRGGMVAAPVAALIAASHVARNVQPHEAQHGRRQVHRALQVSAVLASRNHPRQSDNQRHAQEVLVVMQRFHGQAVLSPEITVVGSKHYQRVVGKPEFVKVVEDLADVSVHHGDHAVHGGDVFGLDLPAKQMRPGAVEDVAALVRAIGREVGFQLLRQGEMRRLVVKLAGRELGHRDFRRIVHTRVGLGHHVLRMRIEKARPEEETLALGVKAVHQRVGPLGDPRVVMDFLGDLPRLAGPAMRVL